MAVNGGKPTVAERRKAATAGLDQDKTVQDRTGQDKAVQIAASRAMEQKAGKKIRGTLPFQTDRFNKHRVGCMMGRHKHNTQDSRCRRARRLREHGRGGGPAPATKIARVRDGKSGVLLVTCKSRSSPLPQFKRLFGKHASPVNCQYRQGHISGNGSYHPF
jgi:hypothetical protein